MKREGNVFTRVCHSAHAGSGVCLLAGGRGGGGVSLQHLFLTTKTPTLISMEPIHDDKIFKKSPFRPVRTNLNRPIANLRKSGRWRSKVNRKSIGITWETSTAYRSNIFHYRDIKWDGTEKIAHTLLSVNRMTDACENITFPTLLRYAVGNKAHVLYEILPYDH